MDDLSTSKQREAGIREALVQLLSMLWDREVDYLIVGGLAAIAHGAWRPLNDIDLLVPESDLHEIAREWQAYQSKPLDRHVGGQWDVVYAQFVIEGIVIEIGSASDTYIQRADTGQWHPLEVDLAQYELREPFDLRMKVMPRRELIQYKQLLDRAVDRDDLWMLAQAEPAISRQG
ncbi:hypothetical protein J2T60_001233 [Natronospira proteinivora]|uniref:Uncharacterized protein n=1 Tax=Natronospira proteinivora TaxID=1807133 RepID=A0ABT1GAJ1_9GAMM|nr:hypothetical protein [Natronospira proteinivora]MCP1727268.1 hypothetical protein [Natronospira proteinivora]